MFVSDRGVSLDTQSARINNQLGHIRGYLEEAKDMGAQWIIVVGHYPIYSAGSNGGAPELEEYLEPLMEEYGVDAYICGHDHTSEHLRYDRPTPTLRSKRRRR